MIGNMTVPLIIRLGPLLAVLALAAIIDAKYRRIPNWLTFSLMAAGLARASWHAGLSGAGYSLLGLLTGASLAILLFAISALGGGDVKLLAGIGAWVGPGPVFVIFLVEAIVGMVIVLIQATTQGRTRILFRNSAVVAANFAFSSQVGLESGLACKSVARPLPYAVPVFIATVLVLFMGRFLGS
jgi:prepilin peptidase CpaA